VSYFWANVVARGVSGAPLSTDCLQPSGSAADGAVIWTMSLRFHGCPAVFCAREMWCDMFCMGLDWNSRYLRPAHAWQLNYWFRVQLCALVGNSNSSLTACHAIANASPPGRCRPTAKISEQRTLRPSPPPMVFCQSQRPASSHTDICSHHRKHTATSRWLFQPRGYTQEAHRSLETSLSSRIESY
jgi:hypothetical protein